MTITGLAGHDTYHVKRVGEQIHVYENTPAVGQPTYSSELAALGASLSINALAGDDTLNVSANGQPNLGVNQLVFNSGSGSNALQLTEGAARIDSTVDVGSVLSSTVSAGAQLTTARLNQNGLTLSGANTKVTILPDGALANVLESLTLDASSTLDLTNNDLILRATAGTKDAIHSDVQAKIASAQNGVDTNFITNWDGPGITSTSARTSNVATGFDLAAIGAIRNSDIDVITGLPGEAYPSFGGVPVSPDDVLVKYTYIGDGNLDGLVSFDDYVGMDNAFFGLIPNLGWATGDINFDNAINFDDYTVVDQAFFFQGAPLASSAMSLSAVPVEAGVAAGHSDSVDTFVPVFAPTVTGIGGSADKTGHDNVWENWGASSDPIVDEPHDDLDWLIAPVGAAARERLVRLVCKQRSRRSERHVGRRLLVVSDTRPPIGKYEPLDAGLCRNNRRQRGLTPLAGASKILYSF